MPTRSNMVYRGELVLRAIMWCATPRQGATSMKNFLSCYWGITLCTDRCGTVDDHARAGRLVGTDFEPEAVQFQDRRDDAQSQAESGTVLPALRTVKAL